MSDKTPVERVFENLQPTGAEQEKLSQQIGAILWKVYKAGLLDGHDGFRLPPSIDTDEQTETISELIKDYIQGLVEPKRIIEDSFNVGERKI